MTNDERIIKKLEKEPYPFNLIFLKMFYMIEENKVSEEDFKISYDRYLNKIPKDEIDFFTKEIENMIMSTSYSDRNKEMCLIRFKEKLSYREIGKRFGISGSRVMDITAKGRRSLFSRQRNEFAKLIYKTLILTIPPLLSSAHTKYMIFFKYGYLSCYDELEKYFPDKIVLNQTSWFDDNKCLQKIARRGIRESIDEVIQEFKRQQHEKTYKVCISEHGTVTLNTTIQHFVIVKAKDIEDALSNVIDHLNTDILERKRVDFNFEKLDMMPNCFWDGYFRDLSQGIQINLKDITNDAFKYICVKYV